MQPLVVGKTHALQILGGHARQNPEQDQLTLFSVIGRLARGQAHVTHERRAQGQRVTANTVEFGRMLQFDGQVVHEWVSVGVMA